MYGLGFLAVILLPLLTRAAPAPTGEDEWPWCCTITTKADFPDKNPNDYFKVSCDHYGGEFQETTQDLENFVWRAECHNAFRNVPGSLHEVSLGVINIDCKAGTDACV